MLRMTIFFVNNLNYNLTPSELVNWFETVGELCNFGMYVFNGDKFSGKCVIQYANERISRKAIETLDKTHLRGRLVKFHYFDPNKNHLRLKKFG